VFVPLVRIPLAVMAISLFAACGSLTPTYQLATVSDPTPGCRDVGFDDAVLRGSPADPRLAWIEFRGGVRKDAIWPMGYGARFRGGIEILDASGTIVLREGDRIDGGCVTRDPEVFLLLPSFP
jgi:hypothetical protein